MTQPSILTYGRAARAPIPPLLLHGLVLFAVVMLGALAGGAIGSAAAPVTYVQAAVYAIGPPVASPGWAEDAVDTEEDPAIDVTILQSPSVLEAVALKLEASGHRIPPSKQTDWLKKGLRTQYYTQNQSVQVTFESSDPRLADGVVNAFLSVVATDKVHGLRSIATWPPGGPPYPRRSGIYRSAAAVVGACAGLLVLWYIRRQLGPARPTG